MLAPPIKCSAHFLPFATRYFTSELCKHLRTPRDGPLWKPTTPYYIKVIEKLVEGKGQLSVRAPPTSPPPQASNPSMSVSLRAIGTLGNFLALSSLSFTPHVWKCCPYQCQPRWHPSNCWKPCIASQSTITPSLYTPCHHSLPPHTLPSLPLHTLPSLPPSTHPAITPSLYTPCHHSLPSHTLPSLPLHTLPSLPLHTLPSLPPHTLQQLTPRATSLSDKGSDTILTWINAMGLLYTSLPVSCLVLNLQLSAPPLLFNQKSFQTQLMEELVSTIRALLPPGGQSTDHTLHIVTGPRGRVGCLLSMLHAFWHHSNINPLLELQG